MISVTTDRIPLRERAEFWADLVSRNVTPMSIEPIGYQALRGKIRARAIGNLAVAQVSGIGVHALHKGEHIARACNHVYAACVHLEGEARITRSGEAIALHPGDIFITDSRQEFSLNLESPWQHLLITLPTDWLDSRVARPELLPGAVVRDHPLARLWARHLVSGFALAEELSLTAATIFARHSVELLAQLLDESHRDHLKLSDASRAAIFLGACEVINLKFGDPDLTPAAIARDWRIEPHAGTALRREQRNHHAARLQ